MYIKHEFLFEIGDVELAKSAVQLAENESDVENVSIGINKKRVPVPKKQWTSSDDEEDSIPCKRPSKKCQLTETPAVLFPPPRQHQLSIFNLLEIIQFKVKMY